jgi:hypothetical protein
MKIFSPQYRELGALWLILVMTVSASGAAPVPQQREAVSAISEAEIVAAQQFGQSLSIAEWLGPMAPVALSPFFGVACLSGLSLFGGDWVASGNPLIGLDSPLHDTRVFGVFLTLTLLTSIPRLTKVSKPFAQAADQLESWSGVITMLVLRYMISSESALQDEPVALVQLGLFSFSADLVLMLAAAVNIFVISAVRFFCEVLIWLTPIPMLDAVFELCNKFVCAMLMALYAWSPVLALTLNVGIFLVALLVFGWVHRREIFFRTMLFDFLRASWGSPRPAEASSLIVFPVRAVGAIKARTKCELRPTDGGWMLTYHRWFGRSLNIAVIGRSQPMIRAGLFSNTIMFSDPVVELTFSRLYAGSMSDLAAKFRLPLPENDRSAADPDVRAEFA